VSDSDPWLDTHLGVYLRDPSLWPVALVGFGIAVTLGAALLAAAVLTRNPVLWGALGILALMTLDWLQRELRARRRLGVTSRVLLGVWVASAGAAALARSYGWI
jgi:hypothetical protein